ncbi:hypothetical protein BDZ88DRAFT_438607 [Geranomyces variabilis]|nr:hypothetical protein BDZ88DRAFT_438607 [Geranomyces variabilis]
MATFTPPALPAGHCAAVAGFPAAPTPLNMSGLQTLHHAYLSAAAKIVFLYNEIPNVKKVHKWGEAHAAHHDALQRADTDMGSGSFTTYDYIAYRVPSTLPNRLQPWLHDVLNEIVAMAAAPLTNPAAPAGAANPPLPLMRWFIQRFYASEFPKNLTANYRLTIVSLALRDSLEDYIRSFQHLLQQEDMAVQINGDLMERSSTLAEQTQWFRDVNGGHATMDQIYNAPRTALSASGIADGAATGQMPIAHVPQQRPAPIPFARPSARYEPYGFIPQPFASRPFYRTVTPSALTPRPMQMLPSATPRYRLGTPQRPGPRMPRFGGQPPKHSLQAVRNNCRRCGRTGHWARKCWAKKTVDGESLETANMAYSVGQSVNTEQDLMDVQHDYDQYDAQCQDDKDPNYMAEAMQEIEQEDFLSTWQ